MVKERTLNRWKIFPNFAKEVFSKITLALPSKFRNFKISKID